MFPEDERVRRVADAFYDPFEYLMLRHRDGKLKTDFATALGSISYQVPCHLRVQNIGLKTRDVLELVPDTKVQAIERCSGHDGTYAVKKEYAQVSRKIARPVARQVDPGRGAALHERLPDGRRADRVGGGGRREPTHPLQLLRRVGLRHLEQRSARTRRGEPLDKLKPQDLLSLEEYHKRARRAFAPRCSRTSATDRRRSGRTSRCISRTG